MIKKDVLEKTSAWPFVEAKKMLRERKAFIEKKGKITLQSRNTSIYFFCYIDSRFPSQKLFESNLKSQLSAEKSQK